MTRNNRRARPAMIARAEFDRLLREVGCRRVDDRSLLPGIHAQRLILLERIDDQHGHQRLLSPAA